MIAQDITNQPLAIGDTVAFPEGTVLRLGEVIQIGMKMVIIRVHRSCSKRRRYFSDVAKVQL